MEVFLVLCVEGRVLVVVSIEYELCWGGDEEKIDSIRQRRVKKPPNLSLVYHLYYS